MRTRVSVNSERAANRDASHYLFFHWAFGGEFYRNFKVNKKDPRTRGDIVIVFKDSGCHWMRKLSLKASYEVAVRIVTEYMLLSSAAHPMCNIQLVNKRKRLCITMRDILSKIA